MEKYEIELYEKEDGSCPVAEFLDELEPKMISTFFQSTILICESR